MIDMVAEPDSITTADASTFATAVLDRPGHIVVEFMSYGCSHCRTLEPVLQQVAARLRGSATFFRVNVALDRDLAVRYDVRGTPTLILFENAKDVGRIEGPHPSVSGLVDTVTQAFR